MLNCLSGQPTIACLIVRVSPKLSAPEFFANLTGSVSDDACTHQCNLEQSLCEMPEVAYSSLRGLSAAAKLWRLHFLIPPFNML